MPNRKQFNSNEEYNKWYRGYREKNRVKLRNYSREYNKKWRKENGYRNEEKYHKKYPEKQSCRQLLNYAIRSKKIKRGVCEVCGKKNAQAHHEDYCKPLEVRWFCPLHHTQHHLSLSTGE